MLSLTGNLQQGLGTLAEFFAESLAQVHLGLEQLFAAPSTPNNINHMATVTEVTRDPNGNVIQYKMYHGHGKEEKGTLASVTTKQYFEFPASMSRSGPYPPLGYWSQRIVAVGTLLPPVTSAPVP